MSPTSAKKTFVVTRFDPDVDQVAKTQSYEIPVQSDWTAGPAAWPSAAAAG
jgi:hypothetical protein